MDKPDLSNRTFWEKIRSQFAGLPPECLMIMADSFVVYSLPSTFIGPETKWGFVENVLELGRVEVPDRSPVSEALAQGFTRTTMSYHVKYMQLWLITLFAPRLKERDPDAAGILQDPWRAAQQLDDCLFELKDRAYDMRHAMLHTLFPDEFERIISTAHKRRNVEAFLGADRPSLKESEEQPAPGHKGKPDLIALDRDVAAARKKMVEAYHPEDADFYEARIGRLWGRKPGPRRGAGETPDTEDVDPSYGRLQELINPLKRMGQLILYGPPGTGKTFYAMKLAEALIASENLDAEAASLT